MAITSDSVNVLDVGAAMNNESGGHYNYTTSPYERTSPTVSTFESTIAVVIPVLFIIIIVFGLIGNILVITVIAVNKHMRNPTNALLTNLAIADLSFLLICIPFTAFKYTTPVWIFGDVWCRVYSYMTFVCAWASVYTLVLMCVDRMFAVVFAIQLPNIRSKRNVSIALAVLWPLILLANIPSFLFHGEVTYISPRDGVERKTCMFLHGKVDVKSKQTFQLCFFIFGFLLPVIAISIMYTILVVFITRKSGPEGHKRSKGMCKTKKKVTVMVIAVVSAFVICWLPIQIILLMANFNLYKSTKTNVIIQIAANCLAYMNSCMNPVLYALASTTFRKAFLELLKCKSCFRRYNQEKQLSASVKSQNDHSLTTKSILSQEKTTPHMKNSVPPFEEEPLLELTDGSNSSPNSNNMGNTINS